MTDPASSGVVRVRDLEATLDDRVFAHPGSRLLRRRRLLTLVVVLVVGGSVGLSAGYAVFLRSGFYRRAFMIRLSERLGVRRQVRLLVTKRSLGPAVFGVFRILIQFIFDLKSSSE